MKKLILIALALITLVGCTYNSVYVLYDSRGCAYSVERTSSLNETPDTWTNTGGSQYQASIMRLASEDKSTCPLKK